MSTKRVVFLFLALCCAAVLTGCGAGIPVGEQTAAPTPEPENQIITFADPIIEAETRRLLDKSQGEITEADVLTVTEFGRWSEDMVKGDISTLADLRWFQNLEYLELDRRGLSSLEGVQALTRLQTLSLRDNNVTDLTPVSGLSGLRSLTIACNPISDYSPLKALTQLKSINMGENGSEYTDLSFLSGMTELTSLRAVWCGVSDISILENMPDLEYLNLFHNDISDISVLQGLKKLNYLELGINNISDVTPLSGLAALTHVSVQDNPISEADLEEFYTPKEEDYFTDTHYGQLHESLPPFRFDLRMYYNRRTDGYSLDTVTVFDNGTGEVLQTISIPELSKFGNTCISIYDEEKGFSLEDVNFDGYLDLRLFDTYSGNYRADWVYLVWDPEASRFVHDSRLNEISLASFDQENQLIYGMERGSAVDHYYYTYQYIDGVPTLVDYEEEHGG